MKKLLLFLAILTGSLSLAQDWQYIGGQGSIGNADEIALAKGASNQLYILKKNGSTLTLFTWDGSSWSQVGIPINTTGTKIQLGIINGSTPVVTYLVGSRIYVRELNATGTAWTYLAQNPYELNTNASLDYRLYTESGEIRIAYYNTNNTINTDDRFISTYVNDPTVTMSGGEIDSDGNPHFKNADFLVDDNDEEWALHDFLGLSDGLSLQHQNGGSWDYFSISVNDANDAKMIGLNSDIVTFYRELGSNQLRVKSLNMDTEFLSPQTLVGSTDDDFSVTKINNTSFVFFRNNSSNYSAVQLDNTNAEIESWSNFGPIGDLSHLRTTNYANYGTSTYFPIVAFIEGGQVSVMELNVAPTVSYTAQTFCVGTSITSNNIVVSDPNYDNSNVTISVTGGGPLSNGSVTGTYPNYNVNFDVDMSSSANGLYSIDLDYDGALTSFDIGLVSSPTIEFSFPTSEICTNQNPINLNNFVTPYGGTWYYAGTQISPLFNPGNFTGGNYSVDYEVTQNGCTSSETFDFTIYEAANLSIASTTGASCGNDNGVAEIDIVSTDPYDIYWSNGDVTTTADSLDPGIYFATVTTDNGCVSMIPAVIQNTDLILSGTVTDAVCYGQANGSIDLTITGSANSYSINWSNGMTIEDPTNVLPGIYMVTVTGDNGCTASQDFTVGSPDQISWTSGNTSATCGNTNGLAYCQTIGGTAPYSWQWYNSSGTLVGTDNDTLENISGGYYNVIITDDNGCTATWNTAVNEVGGPSISIDSVLQAGCSNDGAVYTTIDAPSGIQSITWNNGAITEDITSLTPGYYAISVVDNSGCMGMASTELNAIQPSPIDICMVTVDQNTTTNKVVWEKPVSTSIDHFNVYRETSQAGLFQLVDNVLYSEDSEFTDPVASPQIRSWRYKLTSVDLCGTESELSPEHKTIHLTISQGLGSNINLHWDHYEGLAYSTYDIWRYDATNGWIELTNLPVSSTSYTDVPTITDELDYMVVIDPAGICTSSKANDYNSSRSNRSAGAFSPEGVSINENESQVIEVFPNPSSGQFKLVLDGKGSKLVKIVSSNGKVFYNTSTSANQIDFNLSEAEAGIYYLIIQSDEQNVMKKLVIK